MSKYLNFYDEPKGMGVNVGHFDVTGMKNYKILKLVIKFKTENKNVMSHTIHKEE